MAPDDLRNLVLKHDSSITELASSLNSLVKSNVELNRIQAETNKRLEEINQHLLKQEIFETKLTNLDKNLSESFKRIHKRIDVVDDKQNGSEGCMHIQLLKKDMQTYKNDISDVDIRINNAKKVIDSIPSPKIIMWVAGIFILYTVSFGTYVVNSLQKREVQITHINEHISNLLRIKNEKN